MGTVCLFADCVVEHHSEVLPYNGFKVPLSAIVQLVPSHPLTIEISFPDGNVTRSGRIGFILEVWLPLDGFKVIYLKVLHFTPYSLSSSPSLLSSLPPSLRNVDVTIHWMHNGDTIKSKLGRNLQLLLPSIVSSDAGEYFCQIVFTNGTTVGPISGGVLTVIGNDVIPLVTTPLHNSTSDSGDTLSSLCKLSGYCMWVM